jgi:hypothetical protein
MTFRLALTLGSGATPQVSLRRSLKEPIHANRKGGAFPHIRPQSGEWSLPGSSVMFQFNETHQCVAFAFDGGLFLS